MAARVLAGELREPADAGVAGGAEAAVTLLCAGRAGRVSMDDAWCAGHLVRRVKRLHPGPALTDGARAALELAERLCARVDDCSVVPQWEGGAFVRGGG